jgi:hypothetical protein
MDGYRLRIQPRLRRCLLVTVIWRSEQTGRADLVDMILSRLRACAALLPRLTDLTRPIKESELRCG